MSNSLQPHGQQRANFPCPLLSPGVCSNSCSLSWQCHPIISSSVIPFSSCPQSFPAMRVFSTESVLCMRWPKYWSFSFNISPSSEYSGMISFRIDWFDLLAIQGILTSAPQLESINSSALSLLYGPTLTSIHDYWKSLALTKQTFVGKVMSLLFHMLSRFVKAFLLRSKHLLIPWLVERELILWSLPIKAVIPS